MSARGLSVLIVEDEPMIRMLVTDMLFDLGCHVAGDVEEAVKLAKSAEFDLAILDVNVTASWLRRWPR
jgi:DNA-binding response OmpR family regulator